MDLVQSSSLDPTTLKEDAARAKEMVAIISHAKKAEDRREKLMKNAKTPSQVRTLEKRFVVERRQDAQRIRDLSQEREDLLRVSLARHAGAPGKAGPGRTLDFVKGTTTVKERTTMGSNNLELQFFREAYAKLDGPQPRRAPPGGGRGSAPPRAAAPSDALREKRQLLMRLGDLVVEEHAILGAPSNRSTYSYAPPRRPGSARSVASRASSVASAATVGSRAPAPGPRPRNVPRLRM